MGRRKATPKRRETSAVVDLTLEESHLHSQGLVATREGKPKRTRSEDLEYMILDDDYEDIEEDAERRLLDVLSDVDVLKVAHHGSRTSTSEEFISLLEPRLSVISVGERNRFGHPHPETLWSLRESKVLRTDLHGVIQVEFEKGKMYFIE